jgi:ribosomal protein S18 acetylase RimI-like enzyme
VTEEEPTCTPRPPAGLTLRRAGDADAATLRAVARTAYAHYVERVGREPGPMVDDYERRVAEDECWLVCEDGEDGQVAGYLVLHWEPDHVLLDNVAVAPTSQGRGIGGFLLAYAEHRARAEQRREIRLYTHVTMVENIARYTAVGYVETHREHESGFRRVFMAKSIEL